jgi:hypothetical protein
LEELEGHPAPTDRIAEFFHDLGRKLSVGLSTGLSPVRDERE